MINWAIFMGNFLPVRWLLIMLNAWEFICQVYFEYLYASNPLTKKLQFAEAIFKLNKNYVPKGVRPLT